MNEGCGRIWILRSSQTEGGYISTGFTSKSFEESTGNKVFFKKWGISQAHRNPLEDTTTDQSWDNLNTR